MRGSQYLSAGLETMGVTRRLNEFTKQREKENVAFISVVIY